MFGPRARGRVMMSGFVAIVLKKSACGQNLSQRHDGCSGVVETFGPYVASTGVVTGISFASFLRF
jgi:hypothetical protein